jgi:hypothetical protein
MATWWIHQQNPSITNNKNNGISKHYENLSTQHGLVIISQQHMHLVILQYQNSSWPILLITNGSLASATLCMSLFSALWSIWHWSTLDTTNLHIALPPTWELTKLQSTNARSQSQSICWSFCGHFNLYSQVSRLQFLFSQSCLICTHWWWSIMHALSIHPFNCIMSLAVVQALAIMFATTKWQLILLMLVPVLDSISWARLPSSFLVILIQQRLTGSSWQYLQQQAALESWCSSTSNHANIVLSTTVLSVSTLRYNQVVTGLQHSDVPSVLKSIYCHPQEPKLTWKLVSCLHQWIETHLTQMYPFPINDTLEHAIVPEDHHLSDNVFHTFSLFQLNAQRPDVIHHWSNLFTSQHFLQPHRYVFTQ